MHFRPQQEPCACAEGLFKLECVMSTFEKYIQNGEWYERQPALIVIVQTSHFHIAGSTEAQAQHGTVVVSDCLCHCSILISKAHTQGYIFAAWGDI